MASNFWLSSQFLFQQKFNTLPIQGGAGGVDDVDHHVRIHYTNYIHKLARRIGARQQVIATANVYFLRFFSRNGYRESPDPALVLSTCVYLATKTEECPHHIKTIVSESKNVFADSGGFPYDIVTISEFEFYLLEELEFYSIVHHPYRPLQLFVADLKLDSTFLQTAWFLVNDTYKTLLPLSYPPHTIALAAIYMTAASLHTTSGVSSSSSSSASSSSTAAVANSNISLSSTSSSSSTATGEDTAEKVKLWLAGMNVNMQHIFSIIHSLLDLYRAWESYDESRIPMILDKIRNS